MKDTLMNLFHTLFKKQRTTESIVSPLTKIVTALDDHAKAQQDDAMVKTMKAGQLLAASESHRVEASKAAAHRAAIAGLLPKS